MNTLRNRLLAVTVLGVFLIASGCGTLLYPERRNAPHSQQFDTPVLLMDCAWLLVGIIPGVVALAVDYSNGAFYLPEGAAMMVYSKTL